MFAPPLAAEVLVSHTLAVGPNLTDVAKKENVDTIVMGNRGLGAISVRKAVAQRPMFKLGERGVAFESGASISAIILEALAPEGPPPGISSRELATFVATYTQGLLKDTYNRMNSWLSEDPDPSTRRADSYKFETILKRARALSLPANVDQRNLYSLLGLGSQSEYVVSHAPCPVMVSASPTHSSIQVVYMMRVNSCMHARQLQAVKIVRDVQKGSIDGSGRRP